MPQTGGCAGKWKRADDAAIVAAADVPEKRHVAPLHLAINDEIVNLVYFNDEIINLVYLARRLLVSLVRMIHVQPTSVISPFVFLLHLCHSAPSVLLLHHRFSAQRYHAHLPVHQCTRPKRDAPS